MEQVFAVKGYNGQIEVFENRIDIKRKGFKAFISHGFDGTKSIFISRITAVQFKESGNLTRGFIQFVFPGSAESKKGLGDATNDENSVIFDKENLEEFIRLRDYIFSKIQ